MENEDCNLILKNYYNYNAATNLKLELKAPLYYYDNIYICSYTINNDGKYPFIRYLLTNSITDENLTFPKVEIFQNFNVEELKNYIKVYLFSLLILFDFEKFNEDIEFNGFFVSNNNLYIFIDITKCNIQIYDIYKNNNLWLALIDEIVNQKHLCNIPINQKVTNFFIFNDKFCFLLDKNNKSYEIPTVSYVGKHENKLNFTYTFGETMSNKNSIFGPFYYFTDYYTAFKDGGWSKSGKPEYKNNILLTDDDKGRYTKGGIIRFAIFVGNTKYFENYPNDPIDTSEIKLQRLEDESLNQNTERLTMKISDHNGIWANDYDSVYLGNIELDNGTLINENILVVKDYNQQIPLSYHYINKETLIKTCTDYSIL